MIEKVFEIVKATEGSEEVVTFLDSFVKAKNEAEKTVREQKVQIDQIGDLNIADLKAVSKFVDDNGGIKGVQEALASLGGYKDNADKMAAKEKEWEATKSEMQGKYEASQKELETSTLHSEVLPKLVMAFGPAANDIWELAHKKGQIKRGETGILTEINGKTESFDKEGFETFKDIYKYALQAPSGGGKTGGIGGNDNGVGDKPKGLLQELESTFKA